MKRRLRFLALLVILSGIGGGLWFWHKSRPEPAKEALVLYGNVDIRQAEPAFNDSERIAAILVEEGDRVHKGQRLAMLEATRFKLNVARAEAQVQSQEQVVARLEAGSRPQEIAKAKADLAVAQANFDEAMRTHKRVSSLAPHGAASLQKLDDARAAENAARARIDSLQALYDLAVAGPRRQDIEAAKALLRRLKTEVKLARYDLDNAVLHAPSDGIIQDRILEVGDMASPQKPVFTLALTNPLWIRAYVPEADLGRIREGMKAEITTDSFPGKSYPGWIGFISPTAEFTPKPVEAPEVRTRLVYQVRVFVNEPHDELRLGMPATVTIPFNQPTPQAHRLSGNEPAAGPEN